MPSTANSESNGMFPRVGRWLAWLFWSAPAILIVLLVWPRFYTARATEAAFPVPTYMIMNYPLPKSAYAAAAQLLLSADPADGDAKIAAAEATRNAGDSPARVISLVRQGLSHAPASGRGWTLLAEEDFSSKNPTRAANALSLALTLGPYDYWIAGRRAGDAAVLWNFLSVDDRRQAERQARLLWDEPVLRRGAVAFVLTQGGAALMARALANEPAEIRALNRRVSQAGRREQVGQGL